MLTLSDKAMILPASAIRKFSPLADAAQKKGIKVHHLNIGQPDINSPKEALDAVKNSGLNIISYSDSAGEMDLRKGMVEYYNKLGVRNITEEDINVTDGGSEAIRMTLATLCNPNDEVIVFEPFYTNYNSFAIQSDVKFIPITTTIENGFALPPMEDIEKIITPRTKAILICNPSNPTGALYTKEDVIKISEIAKKHDIFVVTDEVYREFCYTDEPHYSFLNVDGVDNNIILIDSVSKRYSMCGARIGFIVSRNKEFMACVLKYAQARLSSPKFGQIAALGALKAPQSYFDNVKREYILRRDTLVEGLRTIDGVYCPTPNGAFYAAVQFPVDDCNKFAEWLLKDFEYNKQTVFITPMANFYTTPGMGINQARVAYVLNVDDIKASIEVLRQALKVYPGRIK